MGILALVLAILAVVCFVLAARPFPSPRWQLVPLGLALLTTAWIAQVVIIGGYHWVAR